MSRAFFVLSLIALIVLILYVPAWSLPSADLRIEWSSARHDLKTGRLSLDVVPLKRVSVPLRIERQLDRALPAPEFFPLPIPIAVLRC